ncbi:MAG: hypothetical protein ACOH2E_04580 [Candidatus Paracaedibacter sp.]
MSKFFIPTLSYFIITAASLTNNASCAEAGANELDITADVIPHLCNLSIEDKIGIKQENLFFPERSLLEKIPPELRVNVERHMINPATSNFMYLLQQPLSIHTEVAYIEGNFPRTEGCGDWEIDNAERLSIIEECPTEIRQVDEKMSCCPTGGDSLVTKTFMTFPKNTTFSMYAQYYGS